MTDEHKKYVKKIKIRKLVTKILQASILILFIGLWELVASKEIIDPFIISSPSRIVKIFIKLQGQNSLYNHMVATLSETVFGFLISTVLGTIIAIMLWWNKLLNDVLEPYLITLNALPKISLGPLIIIWIGAGKNSIITMTVLTCIIITIISMLAGFLQVDKEKIMLLKSMRANKFQILFKLVLPSNIPTLMSVLKINVGLAWVGAIIGEYLVSREGIGYLIVYGSQVFQLDLVMASITILSILAALMYAIVAIAEKIIKKYF
ncbi:MAG: ABC transporter permease [Clostridiales bacterium]|nr:ABC transporter permease [Clostridiales bacterium]